jgi:hypothetical protein
LSLFFKSKQAFWYSFIERLYELSQSIAEVDTTATPEYSKAFMMQKSKSYIRLLDGMLPIKNILVKQSL